MLSGSRQRHRHCAFVRLPQPRGCGLPVGAFDPGGPVVPPTHDHGQGIRLGRHEEAQPHRRREEALLRSPALLRRLFRETARLRRLVDVVFLVGVCAQLRLRAGWNQKAGQIPVRRSHPAGQPLVGEGVTSPGPTRSRFRASTRRSRTPAESATPPAAPCRVMWIDPVSRRRAGRDRTPRGRCPEC